MVKVESTSKTEEESTERDEFINNGIWDIDNVRTFDSIFIFSKLWFVVSLTDKSFVKT